MFNRWRSILASILGVSIAVGGFYTGAASGQVPTSDPGPIKAPDLTRLHPSTSILVATGHASDLKLSETQLKRLQDLRSQLVPRYTAAQQSAWEADVKYGQKMESGDMIPAVTNWYDFTRREIAMPGILSPVQVYGDPIDRTGTILSAGQQKLLSKIAFESRMRFDIARFKLLFSDGAQDVMQLSAKQRKQLSILIRMFAGDLRNKPVPAYTSSENVGIPLADALAILDAPVDPSHLLLEGMRRQYWFSQTLSYLSPLQKVRLEAFVIDKLYVRG